MIAGLSCGMIRGMTVAAKVATAPFRAASDLEPRAFS